MTNPRGGQAAQDRDEWRQSKQGHGFNFPVELIEFILHGSVSSEAEGHCGTGPTGPGKGRRDRQRAAVH